MSLKLHLIQEHHDISAAEHSGRAKTLKLLARRYFWPGMRKDVDRYCRNCHPCKRSQIARHASYGSLHPLSIPEGAWQNISMDFVTELPWSDGLNAVLMIVCRLTKMRHLIPCRDICTAEQLAELFIEHIFRLHGLPRIIISDRGPQFVARFWQALCIILQIQAKLSTPYHPQTDGQTERLNVIMEQYLRAYVNYLQND